MTKVELYVIGTSTTLESNKSQDDFFQLGMHFELVEDVQSNLPLRGRILSGPIRPEELPHLLMIRVQQRNGIFRAAPCGVPWCHGLLLPLLYMQRHIAHGEGHDRMVLSLSCFSCKPCAISLSGIPGGSVRGKHAFQVCCWGRGAGVWNVSHKRARYCGSVTKRVLARHGSVCSQERL